MIESVNNERVKNWAKLNDKKFQEIENRFLVEGEHLVEEAYKSGNLIEVIVLTGTNCKYDNTTYVTESVMKKITTMKNVPKIIGVVEYLKPRGIEGNALLLDCIIDPGNLGTIIRSAVAFGIDTVVLGDGTVSLYNPKVIRATEGLLFHINIIEADLEGILIELKDEGYTIYSTKVDGGETLKSIKPKDKYAIIIGNEGRGVDKKYDSLVDSNLYIEMDSACESLNAGVATSIILYELYKK